MNEAITAAIAARLGDVADAAYRLKQAVESGDSVPPWLLLRLGLDADSAATALQGHVERLVLDKGDTR